MNNLNTRFTPHQIWSTGKTHKPNKGTETHPRSQRDISDEEEGYGFNIKKHTCLHMEINTHKPLWSLSRLPLVHYWY